MHILETTLKALADKNRIRILALLKHKKMCVCELAHIIGITQPSISRHLKKLKSVGLVSDEQDGFWTNYMLKKPDTLYGISLLQCLNKWVKHEPVIERDIVKGRRINRNTLCKTKARGKQC